MDTMNFIDIFIDFFRAIDSSYWILLSIIDFWADYANNNEERKSKETFTKHKV